MPDIATDPTISGLNDLAAAEIRAIAARKSVSNTALAARLGVTPMWLSRRLRGLTPMTLDDVAAICEALDVELVDVLNP